MIWIQTKQTHKKKGCYITSGSRCSDKGSSGPVLHFGRVIKRFSTVAQWQSGSSNSNPKPNGWMNHEANSICPSSDDDDDADDLCVANVHRLLVVSRQSGSRILHRRVSHVSGLSGRLESHQRSKSHFSCRRKRRPVSETMFPSFMSSIEWRTVAQSSENMQTTSRS